MLVLLQNRVGNYLEVEAMHQYSERFYSLLICKLIQGQVEGSQLQDIKSRIFNLKCSDYSLVLSLKVAIMKITDAYMGQGME